MRKLAYCAGGFSAAIFLAHFLLPVRWVLPGALAAVVLALVTLLLPGQTRRRVMVALLSAAIGHRLRVVRCGHGHAPDTRAERLR